MFRFKSRRWLGALVLSAGLCLTPVMGQEAGQSQNSGSAPDEPTTGLSRVTIDDWVVECLDSTTNAAASCQIAHTVLFGAESAPVFVAAISGVEPGASMRAIFGLPLNIRLKDGLVISDATQALKFQFDRCTHDGCYVETLVSAELFDLMINSSSGFATVIRDSGENFQIPFSFKGFSDAIDAMNLSNSAAGN